MGVRTVYMPVLLLNLPAFMLIVSRQRSGFCTSGLPAVKLEVNGVWKPEDLKLTRGCAAPPD